MNFPMSITNYGPTLSPISPESVGTILRNVGGSTFASTAFPTANVAIYVPFALNLPVVVTQLFTVNGATASNNVDVGIYDEYGTKIVSSGSTARSGTTAIQAFNITDTLIGPGRFYMAVAQNGTTGTFLAMNSATAPTASRAKVAGIHQQATAFPLPATATFATYAQTNLFVPLFGLLISPFTAI